MGNSDNPVFATDILRDELTCGWSVVTTGSGLVPIANASAPLKRVIELLRDRCPRVLTVAPVLSRGKTGAAFLSVDFCSVGTDENAEQALRSLKDAIGHAEWDIHPPSDYKSWQRSFDLTFLPPLRGYWKSRYSRDMSDCDIDHLIQAFESAPTARSAILIEHLHGATEDTDMTKSAFPLRKEKFGVLLSARWPDASDDARCISWVRELFKKIDPTGSSKSYSNYTGYDDKRAPTSLLDQSEERLTKTKRRYDGTNVFQRNHNIKATKG